MPSLATLDAIPAIDPGLRLPEVIGAGALGKLVFDGTDPEALRRAFAADLVRRPDRSATCLDLGLATLLAGQRQAALDLQAQALRQETMFRVAGAPHSPRLRVLALMAPGDLMVNTPLEFILTGSDVSLDLLFLGGPLPAVLPEHDVAFVGACQSEENDALLQRLIPLLGAWPRPVINDPAHLLRLSRDGASRCLQNIPGLAMPLTQRWHRGPLDRFPSEFPCLIRPLNTHAGHGLEKVESHAHLDRYLARHPEPEFFVSPYLDYRSRDGQFRKYRIVFIERQPFLCHLAIASDWMVHYVTADMQSQAANRAEEERAMASFDQDFARRHARAMAALCRAFPLDYFGMDCAETPQGELLVFEMASAMVIHAMDAEDIYPYKHTQMRKTFSAFHRMLERAACR